MRFYLGSTKIILDGYPVAWEFGVRLERRDTMITFMFAKWHLTVWYRGNAKWRDKYIEIAGSAYQKEKRRRERERSKKD